MWSRVCSQFAIGAVFFVAQTSKGKNYQNNKHTKIQKDARWLLWTKRLIKNIHRTQTSAIAFDVRCSSPIIIINIIEWSTVERSKNNTSLDFHNFYLQTPLEAEQNDLLSMLHEASLNGPCGIIQLVASRDCVACCWLLPIGRQPIAKLPISLNPSYS